MARDAVEPVAVEKNGRPVAVLRVIAIGKRNDDEVERRLVRRG